MPVRHLDVRNWRLFETPERRAIAVGAVAQIVTLAAYYGASADVGADIVILGLVGGTVAAALAPRESGLWVEGLIASLTGCGLFMVGFLGWGVTRAAGVGPAEAPLVADAYFWVAVTKVFLFLPLFGALGVFAGLVVGLVRRRIPGTRNPQKDGGGP